jgi:hypothetical protein
MKSTVVRSLLMVAEERFAGARRLHVESRRVSVVAMKATLMALVVD